MVSLITIVSLMIWENLELQNVYKVVKTQEKLVLSLDFPPTMCAEPYLAI